MMKRIETFIFWECENVCCLCTLGPRDAWLQLRKVLVNNLSLENLTCLMNKQLDFWCDCFSLQQLKYMLHTATKEQCQRLKHRKNQSNLVQKNQEDLAKDPILSHIPLLLKHSACVPLPAASFRLQQRAFLKGWKCRPGRRYLKKI